METHDKNVQMLNVLIKEEFENRKKFQSKTLSMKELIAYHKNAIGITYMIRTENEIYRTQSKYGV